MIDCIRNRLFWSWMLLFYLSLWLICFCTGFVSHSTQWQVDFWDQSKQYSWRHMQNLIPNNCYHRRQRLKYWCSVDNHQHTTNNSNNNKGDNNDDDDETILAARIRDDRKFLERNQHWIVFVDDEEAIRQSVGDFLYDAGYQITACADAMAVVEVCKQISKGAVFPRVPSCIVSDIRMPDGPSGLELLHWIKTQDTLKRVPVILLTAKGLTEDRIAGYKAGADLYLPKPFEPNELLSIVDNAITRRQEMMGQAGSLVDLQQEMANLKLLLQENGRRTVKQTDVYLTPAEREVLELVCKGYTSAEIAKERGTAINYVTKTLQKIYRQTGTSTRTELLKWAIQTGYVNPKQA